MIPAVLGRIANSRDPREINALRAELGYFRLTIKYHQEANRLHSEVNGFGPPSQGTGTARIALQFLANHILINFGHCQLYGAARPVDWIGVVSIIITWYA